MQTQYNIVGICKRCGRLIRARDEKHLASDEFRMHREQRCIAAPPKSAR